MFELITFFDIRLWWKHQNQNDFLYKRRWESDLNRTQICTLERECVCIQTSRWLFFSSPPPNSWRLSHLSCCKWRVAIVVALCYGILVFKPAWAQCLGDRKPMSVASLRFWYQKLHIHLAKIRGYLAAAVWGEKVPHMQDWVKHSTVAFLLGQLQAVCIKIIALSGRPSCWNQSFCKHKQNFAALRLSWCTWTSRPAFSTFLKSLYT